SARKAAGLLMERQPRIDIGKPGEAALDRADMRLEREPGFGGFRQCRRARPMLPPIKGKQKLEGGGHFGLSHLVRGELAPGDIAVEPHIASRIESKGFRQVAHALAPREIEESEFA